MKTTSNRLNVLKSSGTVTAYLRVINCKSWFSHRQAIHILLQRNHKSHKDSGRHRRISCKNMNSSVYSLLNQSTPLGRSINGIEVRAQAVPPESLHKQRPARQPSSFFVTTQHSRNEQRILSQWLKCLQAFRLMFFVQGFEVLTYSQQKSCTQFICLFRSIIIMRGTKQGWACRFWGCTEVFVKKYKPTCINNTVISTHLSVRVAVTPKCECRTEARAKLSAFYHTEMWAEAKVIELLWNSSAFLHVVGKVVWIA